MDENKGITVIDIKMPFGSMVVFMIKWAIASIPAAIILFLISTVLFSVLGGFWGGMFGSMHHY